MGILITKQKQLSEIQAEFQAKFPYLKLEFFARNHADHEASRKADLLDSSLTVEQAGNFDHDEDVSIDGHTKVNTLEGLFQDHFGLNVQVFRKSGTAWLLTTATDDWTLSHQNRAGDEASHYPV